MIRCLHVIDHLGLGGAQSALLDMVSHFDKSHIACEVATMHGRGPFADAIAETGVVVHSLAASRASPRHIPNLLALARRGGFDVFHFHLGGSNWLAKPLLALAGHGVRIAHDHSSGDLRFRGMGSLLPDALSHLFSDRVIAVSEGVREFLIQWEALPEDLVHLVPNGVNTTKFTPGTPREKAVARAAIGVSQDTFVVGAMGRFSKEKNFASLARIAAEVPGAVFVVGGDGPERSNIEASIAEHRMERRVRLLGIIEDRAAFYDGLDAFLLPSFHEGLPMVLLEAMAGGVPVVASHLPDLAAALEFGESGLLANPHDPHSFSTLLCVLSDRADMRESLATRARIRCENDFSAVSTSRAVEQIYREAIEGKVAHGPWSAISRS